MRALVTGASGFLGTHLCEALVEHGAFVVELVRDRVFTGGPSWAELFRSTHVTIKGSFEQVERAIAEYELDTVFHLAAQTQVSTAAADPVGTLEANVRGTWQVLEACRRQRVRRVIVASSDKAYGEACAVYTEQTSLRPHGIYATSKACTDMLAQAYAQEYDMRVAIARCGNLYGPGHKNWSTLIPGTIRSILRGERPRLRSNGEARRDFLYIDDAVSGYLKLADSDLLGAANFGAAHFVPCTGWRVLDVVDVMLKIAGSQLRPLVGEGKAPGAGGVEISEQALDCWLAETQLNWRPQHTLEQGLEKTIAWYRENLEEGSIL